MMKKIITNERGFVLVTSMLILMCLMIIGITSINSSVMEMMIATSQKIYYTNFYRAEGGLAEGAQRMEDAPNIALEARTVPGMYVDTTPLVLVAGLPPTPVQMKNHPNWAALEQQVPMQGGGDNPSYIILDKGVPGGGGIGMVTSQVHNYEMYSRSANDTGRVMINIGYRRRF